MRFDLFADNNLKFGFFGGGGGGITRSREGGDETLFLLKRDYLAPK